MLRALLVLPILLLVGGIIPAHAEADAERELAASPHSYYDRPLADRFTRLQAALEAGQTRLDRSGELAFLASLLQALEISPQSQMLVFSTTSLQLSLISPSSPRALYFNEDTYVGYVPGGRIEIVSIDPDLGGIFHIFDIPRSTGPLQIERSRRCMNCHSAAETGYVPGLVIKSVIPGPRGGSLDAFRVAETGHAIPLSERFGGWYLTGVPWTNHWANLQGRSASEGSGYRRIVPGELFDWKRYLVAASDLLPQLLHEHQAGFVNRVLQGTYRAREWAQKTGAAGAAGAASAAGATSEAGGLDGASGWEQVEASAREIVRYTLFGGEAPLPEGGLRADGPYVADFLGNRLPARDGKSLKDFDLKTRLFRHRCSYMIYSAVAQGMPAPLKQTVFRQLRRALAGEAEEFAYLPAAERTAIGAILRETLPGFAETESPAR